MKFSLHFLMLHAILILSKKYLLTLVTQWFSPVLLYRALKIGLGFTCKSTYIPQMHEVMFCPQFVKYWIVFVLLFH